MKCPNCDHERLTRKLYQDIIVDKCSNCGGLWLDFSELDQLEDTVLSNDESKGTLVWNKKLSRLKCPKCNKQMVGFNYRLNDLHLDYCENMHGYWLDNNEEKRVVEEMKKTTERLKKKYKAEEEWAQYLKKLRSPTYFKKLLDLFR